VVEILCTTCDSGFVLDQIAYYEEKDKKIAKEETVKCSSLVKHNGK